MDKDTNVIVAYAEAERKYRSAEMTLYDARKALVTYALQKLTTREIARAVIPDRLIELLEEKS